MGPPPGGRRHPIRNVSFSYREEGAAALNRISLEIPSGRKVALVGPSGAGKSTIFNLLLRFYDIDEGTIASMVRTSER